jgi:AAA15 family ATPase/GTPase
MQLTKISYIDASGWDLQDLELSNLNLIVGKNGTGKSRTLAAIETFVHILRESYYLGQHTKEDSSNIVIEIEFLNKASQKVEYTIVREKKEDNTWKIIEILDIDSKSIIVTTSGNNDNEYNNRATLKNYLTNEFDEINAPSNKLLIHTQSDPQKYPYLDELAKWAETYKTFKFGDLGVGDNIAIMAKTAPDYYAQINEAGQESILTTMQSIGYSLSEIKLHIVTNKFKLLLVKENNISEPILYTELSQGMFRALSTIIYIENLIDRNESGLLLIDDFCEGLDYERATKLGKYVFERCENSQIQLVVTSNDSFLMDTVDLKYWNVLQREGSIVTTTNIKNSPDLFRKFMFSGLSNFDLFSSDFMAQYKQQAAAK